MSRDWTQEELHTASEAMKQNGYMGFEEFCHALEQKQPVKFDFQERNRKELVKDISEILKEKAQYMKMPTCAYKIGNYTIAKMEHLTRMQRKSHSRSSLVKKQLKNRTAGKQRNQTSYLLSSAPNFQRMHSQTQGQLI